MEDYVTFEQALRLKELGFDWKCLYWYHPNEDDKTKRFRMSNEMNHNFYKRGISAPTLSQAAKWLREVKDIIIGIDFDNWYDKYICYVYKKIIYNSENIKDSYGSMLVTNKENEDFDTYEKALLAGIDKALELLK